MCQLAVFEEWPPSVKDDPASPACRVGPVFNLLLGGPRQILVHALLPDEPPSRCQIPLLCLLHHLPLVTDVLWALRALWSRRILWVLRALWIRRSLWILQVLWRRQFLSFLLQGLGLLTFLHPPRLLAGGFPQ